MQGAGSDERIVHHNQPDQAGELFTGAHDVAWENADRIVELADIYLVNGYPDRAIES